MDKKSGARTVIAIILLLVIIFGYIKIKQLESKIHKQQVENILLLDKEIDNLKQVMFKELKMRDSLESHRYLEILDKQNKLKNEYNKITFDYSNIIINRPNF